ncbi:response regulator transcription factor [Lapillicoccus jejuensis]|uniref:DNA-binding response OmpR family regulator n=1 Tax=Lapillicoccus jejuensis TaxID=402171 RepID=A0A542E2X1_9MICO|nr:response regulator transcription factor [Lapillicoccus jejuensis]TQJ09677.1 DNA-binding response OmpR family regulator [Lapillicoccus jejuensis]
MDSILVVDDEARMRTLLQRILGQQGFSVVPAGGPEQALSALAAQQVDLVLLDLVLGPHSGLPLLDRLRREHPQVPVIVVSGVTDVAVRVQALDRGAIDVVGKPFDPVELHARIRRHLDHGTAPTGRYVEAGGLRLDLSRRTVEGPGGTRALAEREAALLAHLMRRRGDVCTREELLRSVWGLDFDPGTNLVDVNIRRLRLKVLGLPMETVRGVGYCFVGA